MIRPRLEVRVDEGPEGTREELGGGGRDLEQQGLGEGRAGGTLVLEVEGEGMGELGRISHSPRNVTSSTEDTLVLS